MSNVEKLVKALEEMSEAGVKEVVYPAFVADMTDEEVAEAWDEFLG